MRKLSTCLVLALVGGVLLAACGSGSKSTSNARSSSEATGSQSSGVSGEKGSSAAGAGATHPLTPKQRVEICQRVIRAPSALSAQQKAQLLKSCEKAGGSSAAQHEIIHEVCAALASHLTAGPARERALAICRSTR